MFKKKEEQPKATRQANGRFEKKKPAASMASMSEKKPAPKPLDEKLVAAALKEETPAPVAVEPAPVVSPEPVAPTPAVATEPKTEEKEEPKAEETPVSEAFVSSWGEEGGETAKAEPTPAPVEEIKEPEPVIEPEPDPEPAKEEPTPEPEPAPLPERPSSETPLGEQGFAEEEPKKPALASVPPADLVPVPPLKDKRSYFDGKPWQVFLNGLWHSFAILITLGVAFPWVYCHQIRWESKHTVYEGKRLHFDGRGSQLIGNWIKWYILSIITLGIYAWWTPIRLQKWKVKHCHFVNE